MARFGNILLTGVNGQVGHELQASLHGLGNVIAVGRNQLDLGDEDAIRRMVQEVRPDLIVNPAAYTAVDKAESEPELVYAINASAPRILAEEAAKVGSLLLHYSTDYVYDGAKPLPYIETDSTNPLGVYGKTKLAGEEAIRNVGLPHLILRTSWVYGARGKNFMNTMIRLAQERDSLRVVADQFGAPTTSYAIAEATAQVLLDWHESKSGVYHMTCGGQTTWHGFTQAILQNYAAQPPLKAKAGDVTPITTADYPTAAIRPANSVLDNTKLKQAFRLALPTWQDALASAMQKLP